MEYYVALTFSCEPRVMNSVRVICFALLCPVALSAQAEPERQSIEISLRIAKADAFNNAMAAFVAEGLVVDRADITSGIIVTVPKISGGMLKIAAVYRANILSVGDTASRVILSGGYTSKDVERLAGTVAGTVPTQLPDEKPLTSKMRRTLGDAWSVIARIAASLEAR